MHLFFLLFLIVLFLSAIWLMIGAIRHSTPNQSDKSLTSNPPLDRMPRWNPENAFDKGLRYEALSEYHEALKIYLQVVRVRPEWAEARYHLGLAHARLRQHEKAWEQFEILMELDRELAHALLLHIAKRYRQARKVP